ncbi:putative Ig domain-containing protein [Vandammella animalimorsus]|uniref:putative Ig domain-containing protein n=1 Tax=Vandammella animalimorsus TaxID=2029117 RepID=UPI0031BB3230
MGTVAGLVLAAHDAEAAARAGDKERAREIMEQWAAEEAGSELGSVVGSAVGTFALGLASLGGVAVSAPVAATVVLGAALLGSIFGADAGANAYRDYMGDKDANGRRDLIDKLSNLLFGVPFDPTALPSDLSYLGDSIERYRVDIDMREVNLQEQARADVAWRYALRELNTFVVQHIDYARHNADGSLDYDNFSASYWQDKAKMLQWKSEFEARNLAFNRDLDSSHVEGNWRFTDLNPKLVFPGGSAFSLGIDGVGLGGEHQVVFGSHAGGEVTGGGLADRLYGGMGADTLRGGSGSDYLDGGQGHDTYVLSSQDSGVDTIVDVDGDGHLEVDGQSLDGMVFSRPNIPIADNNRAQVYQDSQGQYRLQQLSDDGVWELAVRGSDGYRVLARLQNWQDGMLGMQLDANVPGVVPEPERFDFYHRDAPVFQHYIGTHAPAGIWVHGSQSRSGQFTGSGHGDVIYTGGGNSNLVYAFGGSDYVQGGEGRDFLIMGVNRSQLDHDEDVAYGGGGSDIIAGGGGNDTLWGGDGSASYLQADAGTDSDDAQMRRGDWISGQAGSDLIYGSAREDVLFGGDGDDTLRGGAGRDLLLGDADYFVGSGSMVIGADQGTAAYQWQADGSVRRLPNGHAEAGVAVPSGQVFRWSWSHSTQDFSLTPGRSFLRSDRLVGTGTDYLDGGAGDDWMAGQAGDDVLHGGDDNDVLYGDDAVAMPEGSEGNDKLFAGEGRDKLFGGAGSDLLDASEHDGDLDVLRGGGGRDELIGGTGGDELYGEDGEDTLHAGVGGGRMEGGQDGDHYHSSAGDDVMFDVHGNDTYHLSQGQDQITDLGGHDIYQLSFGHLALGGRTLVQDLDGEGSIHYHSRTLKSEDWRATQAGQWQSRDGQLLLQRSGDDLQLRSATPGAQEGVVVFASFFSQQQFLGLQLPEYAPPVNEEEPPANQPPVAGTPLAAQQADEDSAWQFTLPADAFSDPEGQPLRYRASLADGGQLPSWLQFDAASGRFWGTPANEDVGTLALRVQAIDAQGQPSPWQALQLQVRNTNDAPEPGAPLSAQPLAAGQALDWTLPADAFIDVDEGEQLRYGVQLANGAALPTWLHWDAASGRLHGTAPADAPSANLDILITATDPHGQSASQRLVLQLGAANEQPEPQPGSPIVGSEADDTLTGTAARDEIYGLQGNDQIYGLEGDDFLAGYEGNDFLAGGDGRDQLHGDDGDDQLHGGWGEDRIAGGQGQDFLAGGPGDDQLFGDDGEDQLYGDQGSDSLYGGQGHDQLFGSEGDDYLEGGQGEDRLDGGAGRDVLHGGQGSDSLYGGSDGDFYILQAGDGQDRLIEVLDDSAAHDIIELRGLASSDNWQLRRVGQDLHLHYGQGGQDLLIVQDQFAAGAMAIEEIRFSDGVSLSAEQIAQQAIDSAAPGSGSAQGGDTGADADINPGSGTGGGTGSKHGSADQGLTAQPGAAARADIAALLAAAQALPKPASAANADNLPWALGENLQPQHGLTQTSWHAQAWDEADSAQGSTPSSALDSALSSAAQAQQLIAAMAAMAPADALASASFMTAAGYQPGSYQDLTKPLLAAAA